jgi:hypothetical protein
MVRGENLVGMASFETPTPAAAVSRSGPLPRSANRVAVALLAAMCIVGVARMLALGCGWLPYDVPVSDLGRDLAGAAAARRGESPYRQLGELSHEYESSRASAWWVAHAPIALAGARVLLALGDAGLLLPERDGRIAAACGVVAFGLLAGRLVARFHGMTWALAGSAAILLSLPAHDDVIWVQANGILALLLLLVFVLDAHSRRGAALTLLGILIAWKPWVVPFALALPKSRSALQDVLWASAVAALATAVVLPWTGGLNALARWMLEAVPRNLEQYRPDPWNAALTRSLPRSSAAVIQLGVLVLLPLVRRHVVRSLWPLLGALAMTTVAPLLWPHYFLAVAAAIVAALWRDSATPSALLAVGLGPWTGQAVLGIFPSPTVVRLEAWLSLAFVAAFVIIANARVLHRVGAIRPMAP